MFAKECENTLGKPPCEYAIISLGSVARMEATPFSDLEFALLYSDPNIGNKINYFRVFTHFLHLKVINLGETIVPALGIEELNDFQSPDPVNGNWFYDTGTPRGISFDGAMPWASKTPLGRMATESKAAVELIRTPEEMAQLQDEEIAVKEGYHLGMSCYIVFILSARRWLGVGLSLACRRLSSACRQLGASLSSAYRQPGVSLIARRQFVLGLRSVLHIAAARSLIRGCMFIYSF